MEDDEEDTITEPRVTIGAPDIVSLKTCSHSGFLRFQGRLERFVSRTVILKPFFREAVKWRQRFVVLCEGCMYLYKDEYSRNPTKAFSLAGYNRIQRIVGNERRQRMTFKLEPADEFHKMLTFCSSTDDERKVWFKKIKKEMEQAVHVQPSSQASADNDLDEYVALEQPVQSSSYGKTYKTKNGSPTKEIKKKTEKASPRKPLPPLPSDDVFDEEPQVRYDEINEKNVPSRRGPLPAIPSEVRSGKGTRLEKPIKPKILPKPTVPTAKKQIKFSRSEFEFDSNDREKAEELLENMSIGTFLVRKSRQDNQEVLVINTEEGIKEYKIFNKERGLSIDNKDNWFNSTEELLSFYAENEIPHRGLTLRRGFSTTEDKVHL